MEEAISERLARTNQTKTAEDEGRRRRLRTKLRFPVAAYLVYQGATGGLFSDQSESGRALASRNFSQKFEGSIGARSDFQNA
jgi:hypothetical protein